MNFKLVMVMTLLWFAGLASCDSKAKEAEDTRGSITVLGFINGQPAMRAVNWYEVHDDRDGKPSYRWLLSRHQAVIRMDAGTYTICGTLADSPKNLICGTRTVQNNTSTRPIIIDLTP